MKALHRAKDLVATLQSNGSVECSQSNGHGGMQSYTIYTKENNPAFQAGATSEIANQFDGVIEASKSEVDVPF